MNNFIRSVVAVALCSTSCAWASGVIRIADRDCDALAAAAASSPGTEPSLIILARNGNYSCILDVVGNITIDGAGATYGLGQPREDSGVGAQVVVEDGASLAIKNINFEAPANTNASTEQVAKPDFIIVYGEVFYIKGTLILDSVAIANNTFYGPGIFGVVANPFLIGGDVILRNVTIVGNSGIQIGGNLTISNSTIANNIGLLFDGDTVSVGNSIIVGNTTACTSATTVSSLGGNVSDDANCKLSGSKDQAVSDAHLLEIARHGGVVDNVALRNDSPAIGNAIASACEATDARGYSRGQTACDSGAYEFGGGSGNISATGMSGTYFNATNDGHYVSIQRLHDDTALVIWNTFDENGMPAWLYGVGSVSGKTIHVPQVARNTGGKLLPGGDVVGSHAAVWGTFDVTLSDCYNAQLSYSSSDPEFGSGKTSLTRLAFLDDVNCAP
jgi:hypothetical protein